MVDSAKISGGSKGRLRSPLTALSLVAISFAASAVWLLGVDFLEHIGTPHVLAFALALTAVAPPLLAVHALLRPFCTSSFELVLLLPHIFTAIATAIVQLVRRRGAPKFPEWTVSYELFQSLAVALGDCGGQHIVSPANVAGFRRVFDVLGGVMLWSSCRQFGTVAETFCHNGLEHIWIKPAHVASASTTNAAERIVVLFYHGGGYALCSPRFYGEFGNRLRAQVAKAVTDASTSDYAAASASPPQVHVLLANYRKIPEHRFPAPVDDALAMYDYLVHDQHVAPSRIVVAGDSAGGGLVVATLLRLRDAQRALPAAALTICPYVDMLADFAPSPHCFISKSMLAGIRDQCVAALTDSDASAKSTALREAVTADADLQGLPPLLILAAEFDILHSQSLRLAATARRHGVTVELDTHERMPHVFCVLPPESLPQSTVGVERLAAFAAKHLLAAQPQH